MFVAWEGVVLLISSEHANPSHCCNIIIDLERYYALSLREVRNLIAGGSLCCMHLLPEIFVLTTVQPSGTDGNTFFLFSEEPGISSNST